MNVLLVRFGLTALAALMLLCGIVLHARKKISRAALVGSLIALLPLVYLSLVQAGVLDGTRLRFTSSLPIIILAPSALLLSWRLSQLPLRLAPARRWLTTLGALLAVTTAALAIAEPELGRTLDRMTVIVAVDRSRSLELVRGADLRIASEIQLAEQSMRPGDRIGIVVFGADARTEDPPRKKTDERSAQRVEVGREGTDIERAIRRALAEVPADSSARIVLLTDGVQTRGDALSAAGAALAADVPVDGVVLEQEKRPDIRVVSLRAPSRAAEGEVFDLRLVTESPAATEVELRITRNGEVIHSGKAKIGAGEDVIHLREVAPGAGLHRYDIAITAMDKNLDYGADDNSGSAFVRVRGQTLAGVIEGDKGKGAPLVAAFQAAGISAQEIALSAMPADVGELARFDLVVLSDVRAAEMTQTQMSAIASYVRDLGGGLVLMGGDRSLGPGGFARTPIEEVSPVKFDLKTEKKRASLAEVIAIDISGSMGATVGGRTKLDLANEGAARSASLLSSSDRLGVAHVDTVVNWSVPMGPVTDAPKIEKAIRAVQVGGGGIYTDIALDAAYAALAKETVNLKHVLLFADGGDAEQITGCRTKVATAFSRGITTSVISIGRGSDTPELEVLSRMGHGRFYLVEDATTLPAIFSQETILAAKSAISEEPFRVSLGTPGGPTRQVNWAEAPDLKGYVITIPKPRATILLGGPDSDPILATWPAGLGRSAAFTSDFKDRWGKAWLKWPGAAKMFAQLARETARRDGDPRVRVEAEASGGSLRIRTDVVGDDGRAQSFRRLRTRIAGPDGISRDLSLEAIASGRYGASMPLTRPGTYVTTIVDELTGEVLATTAAALGIGDELRPTGSDRALLTRVATITGGRLRDTLAGAFDDRSKQRFSYVALTPWLTLLSAVLMLASVASRRLGMPEALAKVFDALAIRKQKRDAIRARKRADMKMHAAAIADEQRRKQDVLRARKAQVHDQHRGGLTAPVVVPNAHPGQPAQAPATNAPPTAQAADVAPQPPVRELSAAERLALKRRERK